MKLNMTNTNAKYIMKEDSVKERHSHEDSVKLHGKYQCNAYFENKTT
jgi:hypothetical protein